MASPIDSDNEHDSWAGGTAPLRPSFKAHGLVNEITAIETRVSWLDERNKWLTDKLLANRRTILEKALWANKKACVDCVFHTWKDHLAELRMENQLDEQTKSLDQCQQVARELGRALTQEQELRKAADATNRQMREDGGKLLSENQSLRQGGDVYGAKMQSLEKRLREAEASMRMAKTNAEAIVEGCDAYRAKAQAMQRDTRETASNSSQAGSRGATRPSGRRAAPEMERPGQLPAPIVNSTPPRPPLPVYGSPGPQANAASNGNNSYGTYQNAGSQPLPWSKGTSLDRDVERSFQGHETWSGTSRPTR